MRGIKDSIRRENKQSRHVESLLSRILKSYDLYIMIFPVLLYYLVFHYWPMYGVQIAFKNFVPTLGIMKSPWVGMKYLMRFLTAYEFPILIRNTLGISLYSLALGFPIPIILAIMINEVRRKRFKRFVQTVTYAPHFISTVVLVGMLVAFLSPRAGLVNIALEKLGVGRIHFIAKPEWFKTLYVFSGIWQNAGWASIIFISALGSIDPQLYEAAVVDGATKIQKIRHIDIPGILPTATIILILNTGHLMSVGFEKVFLMQNSLNMEASDVISTYVYRAGLLGAQYSFATAVGLFNSAVNFVLLVSVNAAARRLSDTSLW